MARRCCKRGFPRTHYFAQARSVFAVAAHRCAEVFDPPDAATFWRLTDEVEEAFDARWEGWLDSAPTWAPFFESDRRAQGLRCRSALKRLSLVDDADVEAAARLKLADGEKGVLRPGSLRSRTQSGRAAGARFRQRRQRRPTCPIFAVEEGMRPPRSSPSGTCARALSSRRPIGSSRVGTMTKTVSENLDLAFLGRFPTIAWETGSSGDDVWLA